MPHESPLRKRHEAYSQLRRPDPNAAAHRPGAAVGMRATAPDPQYVAYGPLNDLGRVGCELLATFGDLEAEYAAIRKGAGLFDCPHRATIRITGDDRREFLNRMLTQELKDLQGGMARPTFWLSRQGRLVADLLLIELGDRLLIDLDIHQVDHTVKTLRDFLFTEDVEITDVSSELYHLAVHGKEAQAVIAEAGGGTSFDLDALGATTVRIAGVEVVVARLDQTGEVGLHLIVPQDQAEAVWDALVATDEKLGQGKRRIRPIGWHAVNVARIEAGIPLFNIDFGPMNLPHETGQLHDRVSFTKGCYLGQEIVARMESLGSPKQILVGLKPGRDLLPVAGDEVFSKEQQGKDRQIGVVTSSTLSPMLGAAPIAFAMLKTKSADPDTTVLVNAEGEQTDAVVCGLRFYNPVAPQASSARETGEST